MELSRIHESLSQYSSETESIYTKIASSFPALLAINTTAENTSLSTFISLLDSISSGLSVSQSDEASFFERNNAKKTELFAELNGRMEGLVRISERVSSIRSDSEELEIIALNAMIVSIKSGEKGRVFSCITDKLKFLTAKMIELTSSLLQNQKKMLVKNDSLRESFFHVSTMQQKLLDVHKNDLNAEIRMIAQAASKALHEVEDTAKTIFPPILEAMTGIQLQDIVRQSIDQILLALAEIKTVSADHTAEDKLDLLTFNSELFSISSRIARDVVRNLESSIATFSTNWFSVHNILDEVENQRINFLATFLDPDNSSGSSIPVQLEKLNSGFLEYIDRISQYQQLGKTMVRDSGQMIDDAKQLRILFESIEPIIQQLQYVRINQQIEVSKNKTLNSIFETVDFMSSLINHADDEVQETSKELMRFIAGIDNLIGEFSVNASKENDEMTLFKKGKTEFFYKMKKFQDDLSSSVINLQVYPESFQNLCRQIDIMLDDLKKISGEVSILSEECEQHMQRFESEKDALLASSGLKNWILKNTDFKNVVKRFTITSHKVAAGEIGGFEIENKGLNPVESGGVKLF